MFRSFKLCEIFYKLPFKIKASSQLDTRNKNKIIQKYKFDFAYLCLYAYVGICVCACVF